MKVFSLLKIFVFLVSLIAAIITIIVFVFPTQERIKMSVSYVSFENLTDENRSKEPELNAVYYYKGETIDHLWKVRVNFENTSNKTIIGRGSQKNIIPDTITLNVKKGCRLIDKKLVHTDFAHNMQIINNDLVSIGFDQWRSGEAMDYFLYIQIPEGLPKDANDILSQPESRQIIDGDIFFNLSLESEGKDKLVTSFLPSKVKKIIYIVAIGYLGVTILVLFIIIFCIVIDFVRKKQWLKINIDEYKKFLSTKVEEGTQEYNKYLKRPDKFWDKYSSSDFQGKKYPRNIMLDDLSIANYKSLLSAALIIIICIVLAGTIFIDLIQLFP